MEAWGGYVSCSGCCSEVVAGPVLHTRPMQCQSPHSQPLCRLPLCSHKEQPQLLGEPVFYLFQNSNSNHGQGITVSTAGQSSTVKMSISLNFSAPEGRNTFRLEVSLLSSSYTLSFENVRCTTHLKLTQKLTIKIRAIKLNAGYQHSNTPKLQDEFHIPKRDNAVFVGKQSPKYLK